MVQGGPFLQDPWTLWWRWRRWPPWLWRSWSSPPQCSGAAPFWRSETVRPQVERQAQLPPHKPDCFSSHSLPSGGAPSSKNPWRPYPDTRPVASEEGPGGCSQHKCQGKQNHQEPRCGFSSPDSPLAPVLMPSKGCLESMARLAKASDSKQPVSYHCHSNMNVVTQHHENQVAFLSSWCGGFSSGHYSAQLVPQCRLSTGMLFNQWEFQDPKMEVPTLYKAYDGLCKGYVSGYIPKYGLIYSTSILGSWNAHSFSLALYANEVSQTPVVYILSLSPLRCAFWGIPPRFWTNLSMCTVCGFVFQYISSK